MTNLYKLAYHDMASLFFVVVQLFYISSYTTNAATNCSDICGIVDSDITTFGSRFRRSARGKRIIYKQKKCIKSLIDITEIQKRFNIKNC